MKKSINETERRRMIQETHNRENGITPQGIRKTIRDITERVKAVAEPQLNNGITGHDLPKEDIIRLVKDLEVQMKSASRNLEYQKAAVLRDQIIDLRKVLAD